MVNFCNSLLRLGFTAHSILYCAEKQSGGLASDPLLTTYLQLHTGIRTYVGVCSKNSRFFSTLAQVNQAANGRKKADKVFQSFKQAHTGYDQL